MKNIKFAVILMALAMIQISCDKNDDDGDNTPKTKTHLTVAEGKSEIEKAGTDLLTKIDMFRSDQSVIKLHELSEYLDQNIKQKRSLNNSNSIIRFFLGLGDDVINGKLNAKSIVAEQNRSMNSNDLWDDYQNETGVYVWDSNKGEFEKREESNNLDYSISYTVNGISKSAKFLVTNFSVKNVTPHADQMIKSVDVSFKIDAKECFNFKLASEYSNYLPTSLTSSLTFGSLSSTLTYTNEGNSNISAETKIILNGTQLLKFNNEVAGNFTMLDDGQEPEDEDIPNIFTTANSRLTIMNIVLSVNLQVTTYGTWINNNPNATKEENIKQLNNNCDISISTTSGQEIANAEYYLSLKEWTDYEYNNATGENLEVIKTKKEVDIRFVFDDGTSADFETYFGEGFQTLEDKFKAVSNNYEAMSPKNL